MSSILRSIQSLASVNPFPSISIRAGWVRGTADAAKQLLRKATFALSEAKEQVPEQLVEVVKSLVDDPDSVSLATEDLGGTVLLNVTVAEDELGRVIGRQGRTVRALRTLLEVRGTESGVYYDLEVVDP